MKHWIEVCRIYYDDDFNWYPHRWQACLKTENGRIIMKAHGHHRRIDAIRSAKMLGERLNLEVRTP
jgi:hypothetical protein